MRLVPAHLVGALVLVDRFPMLAVAHHTLFLRRIRGFEGRPSRGLWKRLTRGKPGPTMRRPGTPQTPEETLHAPQAKALPTGAAAFSTLAARRGPCRRSRAVRQAGHEWSRPAPQ